MHTTLIEPPELATRLTDPSWAILDCRFELAQPQWGASAYAAGHVPNALYSHLDKDLSGPVAASTGRHPLPETAALAQTFGRWGIDARSEEHTSELQSLAYLVCRLLLEKKKDEVFTP